MTKTIWFFLVLLIVLGAAAQDTSANFDIITAENAQNLQEIQSWTDAISPVAFSPDSTSFAVLMESKNLEFISTETLETIRIIEDIEIETDWVEWLLYSADGSELLLLYWNGYTLLDLETEEIIASYNNEGVISFGFTADLRRYLQIEIGEYYVSVHELLTNEEIFRVEDVTDYEFSPDGRLLVTINREPLVQVWDVDSREVIFEIVPPSENAISNEFAGAGISPDGMIWVNWVESLKIESGESWTSTIQFWDMASASLVQEFAGNAFYNFLTFENDYVLAWGLSFNFSESCSLWNLVEKVEILCPTGGNGWATISPNGELLLVSNGTSPNVYIYALETIERPIHTLETISTWFVGFSPDSRLMITIDHEMHLWAIPNQE